MSDKTTREDLLKVVEERNPIAGAAQRAQRSIAGAAQREKAGVWS